MASGTALRMNVSLYVIIFVLFVLNQTTKTSSNDSPNLKLVCYVETWASSRSAPMNYNLDRLPDNTCDFLVVLFVTLEGDTWKLKMNNGYTPVEADQLKKAVESKKRNPSMKVLLSVGGWADGAIKYSNMMLTKQRRSAFVESVVDTLEMYGFDGLELHWIYPGSSERGARAQDKDNFVALVQELVVLFEPKHWILTASVPADRALIAAGYDVRRLDSLLYQMHVHTFDLRGVWTNAAENHSPLYRKESEPNSLARLNVNDALIVWLSEGASIQKLIPTFPLFGRSFTLALENSNPGAPISGEGIQGQFTMAPGILAYFEICEKIREHILTRHYDNITETPYAVGGNQWVGFDDEVSLKKKAELVRERGYGGAALFAISMDDFIGVCGEKHYLLNKMRGFLFHDNVIV